jgi:hypothetical protein
MGAGNPALRRLGSSPLTKRAQPNTPSAPRVTHTIPRPHGGLAVTPTQVLAHEHNLILLVREGTTRRGAALQTAVPPDALAPASGSTARIGKRWSVEGDRPGSP